MKLKQAGVLALVLALVLAAGAVAAQPGDLKVVTGTVVYPDTVRPDSPFAVVRGDDRTYYADLSAARPATTVRAGQRVTVVGYQGREPDQLVALGIEPAGVIGVPGAPVAGLNIPQDHEYQTYDGQGASTPVPPADVPARVQAGVEVYDRTANQWVNGSRIGGGINPAYLAAPSAAAPGAPAPSPAGDWARVHGTVQSVAGSTLQFRADDGRTLSVDTARVNPEVQQALKPQVGATLIGFPREGNRFEARYIQQDASDPTRGGTVVGQPAASPATGPVDEQAWQRVRGVVQSIEGNRLRVRAQDGRTVTADIQQVSPVVRNALTSGDEVTVVGFYRGNRQTMSARYVQQEGGASASPPTR